MAERVAEIRRVNFHSDRHGRQSVFQRTERARNPAHYERVRTLTNVRSRLAVLPRERAGSLFVRELGVAPDMQRILIVDDDAESTDLLAMLLHATGLGETQATRLGSAAVALAVEFRATIVFIDLKLPDMSGYDVARLLHQHPSLRKLRLIALTDNGEHAGRESAREAGFERYLLKPVTRTAVDELLAMS